MTYKLWHDGNEHGPYTRDEIAERHQRGELVGILWRRIGETRFRPHTDLDEELAPPSEFQPVVAEGTRRHSAGGRRVGLCLSATIGFCGAGLLFIGGVLATLSGSILGGAMMGSSLVFGLIAMVVQIHEVLQVIAQRLDR
jgi:hypothetical protein